VLRRLAPIAQRVMLRTDRGPLRPIWAASYELIARGVATYVRRGCREASVYVRGSVASGEPVYGLSDIDMIVVAPANRERPGEVYARLRARHARLWRRFDVLWRIMRHFFVYEEPDLREAASASTLTYGLDRVSRDGSRDRACYLGARPVVDEMSLLEHPGLDGLRNWRRVAGRERRPPEPRRDAQTHRIAAWLELQAWWRWAFDACVAPNRPHVPLLCVKLVSEPARVWLWLDGHGLPDRRSETLERAIRTLPDEEDALRAALDLEHRLGEAPDPPLGESLATCVRLSSRIARRLESEVTGDGTTQVRLVDGKSDPLPLVDWRALVLPLAADEAFVLTPYDASAPADVARACTTAEQGVCAVIEADHLVILPTADIWTRGLLRAVQCPVTDPVTFALARGKETASFPDVAGWSAIDVARRAVAEHRAWLAGSNSRVPTGRLWLDTPLVTDASAATLGMLLTATRAALFLESLEEGKPELALTLSAVAGRLADREAGAQRIVEEALGSYRTARLDGVAPSPSVVSFLRRLVGRLPAYAGRVGFG
jgi:predicted nucleotidyltransferase